MFLLERLPIAVFSALLTLLLGGILLFGVVLLMMTPDPLGWLLASWMWKGIVGVAALFFVLGMLGQTALIEATLGRALRLLRLFYFFR